MEKERKKMNPKDDPLKTIKKLNFFFFFFFFRAALVAYGSSQARSHDNLKRSSKKTKHEGKRDGTSAYY